MKYFYIQVTTQYDGYEWTEKAISRGRSIETVTRKAQKFDFTHDNGIEVQEEPSVEEISKAEYEVLANGRGGYGYMVQI